MNHSSMPPRMPGERPSARPSIRVGKDGSPLTFRAAWRGMTKGQRAFIFGWSGLLILTSALLFFLLTSQQIQRRQAILPRPAPTWLAVLGG